MATYRNPVVAADCPDPTILFHAGEWWTATTSGGAPNAFPLRVSDDLVTWRHVGAVFPATRRPAWIAGDCWAPELAALGDGFACWYTARDRAGRLCIGLARASDPAGPWEDLGAPFIRTDDVGQIDPAFLRVGDRQWLYWKEDGNDLRPCRPTVIYGQEVDDRGRLVGREPASLMVNDLAWEGDLVEAPCVLRHDGWYWMFYSGNAFYDERYATGVARSRHPLGPFEKRGAPILTSGERWQGPGHGVVVEVGNEHWFLYHAWGAGAPERARGRQLLLDRIAWGADGWPLIADGRPSADARPLPAVTAARRRSAG